MLLPTHEDTDDDLVKEWHENTEECSVNLMRTLTKHEDGAAVARIELIMKELERHKDEKGVKTFLVKREKSLQGYDNEIMERKARTFTRGPLDYQ
ncbi:hypothetical protein NDU88_008223 [Pleurodeles waltl]|uniref:Uncharacterized protein n=1 Tax=Pleurodeles waltl TaxID=8319 RepID=A0AAV7N4D8_PLEWA|nr:hypothetical protein NDU88_008223 [Pleurodeles waltl]